MTFEIDPEEHERLRKQMDTAPEAVVYAIKWVIGLKKVRTMAVTGADAGSWAKQRVDPIEKLVRIRAALLTLPEDIRTAIEDEAVNRVECMIAQANILKRPPLDPWE